MARLQGSTLGFEIGTQWADGIPNSPTATYDSSTPLGGLRSLTLAGGNYVNLTFVGAGVNSRNYYGRLEVRCNSLPSARQHLYSLNNAGSTNSYGIWAHDSDGTLRIVSNDAAFNGAELAATGSLGVGQTAVLEIMALINTGGNDELRFRLNGTEYGPFTGAYSTEVISGATLGPWLGNGGNYTIDNHGCNDNQGANANSWCGIDRDVLALPMASDPGTSSANWQKPGGGTTDRHTSVDTFNPETYDSTSASAEDYLRNAVSGANAALLLVSQTYTAAGVGASDIVRIVEPYIITGGSSATDTAGDVGLTANPVIAQASFAAFDNGIASSTVTTWPWKFGTIAYDPAPTKGTGATLQVRKVTATTRVGIVNTAYVIVEVERVTATPALPVRARRGSARPTPPAPASYA